MCLCVYLFVCAYVCVFVRLDNVPALIEEDIGGLGDNTARGLGHVGVVEVVPLVVVTVLGVGRV